MIAAASSCMAGERRGESLPITPYARNFVTAIRASDVILALVELDFMTCKNGCRSEGVSKVLISVPSS